jgi:hypothetical protein
MENEQELVDEQEITDEEIEVVGDLTQEEEEEFDVNKFFGFEEKETPESLIKKVEDKFGFPLLQMQAALSKSVVERAEELTLDMLNIAPKGDYENLLENNDDMADFLKTEAQKPEHWKLMGISVNDFRKDLLSFSFFNQAVDDGNTLEGFVFTSQAGKIKHAFAQVEK